MDNESFVYRNAGLAIQNPDRYGPSKSQNPEALEHKKKGQVIVFEKDNYFEILGCEAWIEQYPNHTLLVPTLYSFNGKNYTLTYIFKPGGHIDDLDEGEPS